MSPISYLLPGAIIGAVAVWLYKEKKIKESEQEIKRLERERGEQEEDASGLESFNEKRQKKIEGRKDKIVEAIKEKGSIQTGEVADMFEVSRNTAYRYLEELEKEGKLKQVKKFGRGVRYRLSK